MRLSLTYKFVVGSLVLAGAVIAFPGLMRSAGLEVSTVGLSFVALGVGGVFGFFLSQYLTSNFQTLQRATERISRGDLSAQVALSESRFPDETHDLARSVGAMAASLRELVGHVQRTADHASASAQDLARSAQELAGSNEGISSTVAAVARSVSHEQELLQKASQLIHDIAQSIEVNSGRAREAFGFAAEANQKANTGVNITQLALEKMRLVFERVEQASGQVFHLEEKTGQVHQIIEIITSVAQRTNLLSLNASIEAARAGEAGRGFAVVADEIRKLAESASRSAEDISKLIHEIQADTQAVAEEMRDSGRVINEGRDDVNTIASSLDQIRGAVSEASGRAEEIFHQADKQTRDAERMVSAMDDVAGVAAGNAKAMDEVSNTTRDQLEAMGELVSSTQNLTTLADDLRGVLRRFRTDGTTEAAREGES